MRLEAGDVALNSCKNFVVVGYDAAKGAGGVCCASIGALEEGDALLEVFMYLVQLIILITWC